MDKDHSIVIKKFVLHILDSSLQMPVLSDEEHPLDEDIAAFIEGHIAKMLKNEGIKNAHFTGEQNAVRDMCVQLKGQDGCFIDITHQLAERLYGILCSYPDIPSADFVCCLFELDGMPFLGMLKFNYRTSFIHHVENLETGRINSIIKQKTALPGENQRVDEGALINLEDLSIKLLDKKYDINGEKMFYLSSIYLDCEADMSDREKVRILKNATKNFSKEYFEGDYKKQAEIKKAVAESVDQMEAIDIEQVAQKVFNRSPELQESYIKRIEKEGMREKVITLNEKVVEKNFKKHKIKTDTGIEINVPIDHYHDPTKVEFINNPDGTISIVIKNIRSMVEK